MHEIVEILNSDRWLQGKVLEIFFEQNVLKNMYVYFLGYQTP